MDKTRVVNVRCEEFDVYIGRPGPWGNPYVIGKHGGRAQVIASYRGYVTSTPRLMKQLPELRGRRLGCYCAPLPCHGDVLVELIEELERKEQYAGTTERISD